MCTFHTKVINDTYIIYYNITIKRLYVSQVYRTTYIKKQTFFTVALFKLFSILKYLPGFLLKEAVPNKQVC